MKTSLILFCSLFAIIFAYDSGNLMVRLKDQTNAEIQLTLSQLENENIKEFKPLLKREKVQKTKLSIKAQKALNNALRFYHVIPSVAFYQKQSQGKASLKDLQNDIMKNYGDFIDACFISPAAHLPVIRIIRKKNEKSTTPSFVDKQVYLENAPRGVGQSYTFDKPGGRGNDVRVVDVEGGWDLGHEDLAQRVPRLIHGVHSSSDVWLNHGSAVFGEISGDYNNFGVTGIAPNSELYASSIYVTPTRQGPSSNAMMAAANFLRPGDIILIELHAIGPNRKFIPMEFWPDNFAALKFATEKGVIVVEAGGNGNENLDLPIYNNPLPGFPRDWKNPFNRSLADSGAILVGAGAPPPGTNGRDHGPTNSRLGFSNYGSAIDCQGYGFEVTTLGYGDLQRINRNRYYTSRFSGTSSASPIVVGAVAALQGVAKNKGRALNPEQTRNLLRTTGTPQTDHPQRPRSQRIGRFPNLKELLEKI